MATVPLVPVDEYLQTTYEPDRDYVDGVIADRNVGEYDHSTVQGLVFRYLLECPNASEVRVKPELRMKVSATRYRVPDLLVMRRSQSEY